jgi:D-alanyl-D-alanine carboxypeptidase/D-alanyl-D-alanine-endopeptidase (penicillin-binding protein 4)
MMKYILSTICLISLLFWPTYAQENPIPATAPLQPVRLTTISESNYFNQLAMKGFKLSTQGLLVESLDGRKVYAELNSTVGFNPASVIKVATSFAALAKVGPDYHFETAVYSNGEINKKTRTLSGDLIFHTTGDPVLSTADVTRMLTAIIRSGIARVTGDVFVTGPFTYGPNSTTERATVALSRAMKRAGIKMNKVSRGGKPVGTLVAHHLSPSLRDILFYTNAHSVNSTAERIGEAFGGPKGIERFLIQEVGIAPGDIDISRTSGLEFNRITARATVKMMRELVFWLNLQNMQPQDVMPVAGVDAGTLQRRFTGEEYRGAVIGKTGTLPATDGGVSTLAGIIYTRDFGPVLFAIFNTKGSVTTYRRLQDDFLKGFIIESGGIPDGSASLHRLNN